MKTETTSSCYWAIFPAAFSAQLSSATAFCRTYNTTVNNYTAITQFPTRATAACGPSPAKYSSFCSCGVPPAPTPPTCPTYYIYGNFVKTPTSNATLPPGQPTSLIPAQPTRSHLLATTALTPSNSTSELSPPPTRRPQPSCRPSRASNRARLTRSPLPPTSSTGMPDFGASW
jgi:hypothetical protein